MFNAMFILKLLNSPVSSEINLKIMPDKCYFLSLYKLTVINIQDLDRRAALITINNLIKVLCSEERT